MSHISVDELAQFSFRARAERGMFAMLEFYYDDSGTHRGSDVVVWGGVTGYKEVVDELDHRWRERLLEPVEGRPPISKFSLSQLLAGRGEFEGYNDAEKDRARHLFRKAIVDSGVSVLAYAISQRDWDELATPAAKVALGSAERMIFGLSIMASCKVAINEGQPLSFIFDKGRRPSLDSIIAPAIEAAELNPDLVGYGFQPVASVMPLQAADLVAGEAYRFAREYLIDQATQPNPHMRRLIDDAQDSRVGWIGREQIASMLEASAPAVESLLRDSENAARSS